VGSIPAGVIGFSLELWLIQTLNRNQYLGLKGGRRVSLRTSVPSVSRLSRKCGSLDVSWTSTASYMDCFILLKISSITHPCLFSQSTALSLKSGFNLRNVFIAVNWPHLICSHVTHTSSGSIDIDFTNLSSWS
jgi:hypothetical protein